MKIGNFQLKLPVSLKNAAAELAKLDGVSLNQFIASAVAEKVGAVRTAREFLAERAGTATPADMMPFIRRAPRVKPDPSDAR